MRAVPVTTCPDRGLVRHAREPADILIGSGKDPISLSCGNRQIA